MNAPSDRLAIISDTHGNLPALEATLADIRARGIDRIFCLGDLAGKGPSGAEIVDLCRDACEAVVQGNWDAGLADETDRHPVVLWHREQLGAERVAYLRDLPAAITFTLSGRVVRLFHASQRSVHHRVRLGDPVEVHRAMFDNTDFTGGGPSPDVVGYGDIHMGYVKSFSGKCLFNAGSVGNPLDITQACYAILEGQYGSERPAPWGVNLVRVPYDIEEAVRQAEISGMPELALYATELRTAIYRGRQAAL
jgi:predicted phosphodiesterase